MGDAGVGAAVAGWYADPTGRFEQRFWTGREWSEHVHSSGVQGIDAMPPSAPQAEVATEVEAATTTVSQRPVATDVTMQAASAPAEKISFWGARDAAKRLQAENARLQTLISDYGLLEVAERDRVVREWEAREQAARATLRSVEDELRIASVEREAVKQDIVDLRATAALQDLSIFDFEHPAESSVTLATDLAALRAEIKSVAAAGRATDATSGFTYNNSRAKGDKFVRDMSKPGDVRCRLRKQPCTVIEFSAVAGRSHNYHRP